MTHAKTDGSLHSSGPFQTAVLFLIFNRPDVTQKVFDCIRKARPPRLYVAADGPRVNRPGESEKCEQTRRVIDQVDWPCELKMLFRAENLGCKRAVSTAIDWFFQNESEGIILEDDCLPSPSFFGFCQELLAKYRDDERIWQICGTAFLEDLLESRRPLSYSFSKYGPIWGWASWRRAWKYYDSDLGDWPKMSKEIWLASAYEDVSERKARLDLGGKMFRGEVDTWDYQWGFAKNYQSGLSIIPTQNLIINIGFGADATHTLAASPLAPLKACEIEFPLVHPPFVIADAEHDRFYRKKIVAGSKLNKLTMIAHGAWRSVYRKGEKS